MKKILVLFLSVLLLSPQTSAPADSGMPVTPSQNQVYRSLRKYLNMGMTLEAAKIYAGAEFGIQPAQALEDYFAVKFYRMKGDWRAEMERRIREALGSVTGVKKETLADFTVSEDAASFSFLHSTDIAGPVPILDARETARRIAEAVFSDVPELDIVRIYVRTESGDGRQFSFMKQPRPA